VTAALPPASQEETAEIIAAAKAAFPSHAAQEAAIASYLRWRNRHPKRHFAVNSKIRRPNRRLSDIAESADASDRVLLVWGSVFFGDVRCECRDHSRMAAAHCGRRSDPFQHRAVLSSEVQTADDSR
jgi:hypothetical protein